MVLKENMNSSNPAWKVMGLKEVQERQQKRKDQQQNKETKLREKQSNEFTTEQSGVSKFTTAIIMKVETFWSFKTS